jgi:hypothetical protein
VEVESTGDYVHANVDAIKTAPSAVR